MAEYVHVQSGARVSVADGKVLGVDFVPADEAIASERSEAPDKSWKVAELKAYAEEHEIDLGAATNKEDILTAINDAGNGSSEGDGKDDSAGDE